MPSISHGYLQPTRKDMKENGNPPQEQKFHYGVQTPYMNGVCVSGRVSTDNSYTPNTNGGNIEVRNDHGKKVVAISTKTARDGSLANKVTLFVMQVRRKDTGEIVANGDKEVFEDVYNWTKRSITILSSSGNNSIYDRAHTITFPYDVEVYDPVDPKPLKETSKADTK